MYTIIGGDRQEYGPVNAEQLARWLEDGRVNAQTLARTEPTAAWQPLSAFPEFTALLEAQLQAHLETLAPPEPPALTPPPLPGTLEAILERDYRLHLGECLAFSLLIMRKHFWRVMGVALPIFALQALFSWGMAQLIAPALKEYSEDKISPRGMLLIALSFILSSPVYAVLNGGLYQFFLKLIRHETPRFGEAFYGLTQAAGPLLLLGLVSSFLSTLGACFCLVPGIYLIVAWAFAVPLLVDRGLGFWEALEFSRQVVTRRWLMVFIFIMGLGLIEASLGFAFAAFPTQPSWLQVTGTVLGYVVQALIFPILGMALMYAYETIFGTKPIRSDAA